MGEAAIGMASSYFFTSRFLGQQVSLITTPQISRDSGARRMVKKSLVS